MFTRFLALSFCFISHFAHAQKTMDFQGHRGCRALRPENTIASFIKALELGVTTLEMDVVVSADGQLVVSHEPFLNHEISRKPDGQPVTEAEEKSLNLYRMRYRQIKRYDVGLQPHPRFPNQAKMAASKPRLNDVVKAVKRWCKQQNRPLPYFNIETKCQPATDDQFHPKPDVFAALLSAKIKQLGIANKCIIQSFDERTLKWFHQHDAAISLALLVEPDNTQSFASLVAKLGFTPQILSPHFSKVDAALVGFCQEKKMKLIPWTVNDLAEIKRLIGLNVDGIISDDPRLFSQL